MDIQTKIEQLQTLFAQRAEIDRQIIETFKTGSSASQPKERAPRKWGQKRENADGGGRKGRPRKIREYRCLGCGNVFNSNLPKIDAYCPNTTCNKSTEIEEVNTVI